MDEKTYKESIRTIAAYYGLERQERKLFEEMAELVVALTHDSNVIEELADVQIMIDQISYLCFAEDAVESWKERKIKRTIERIEDERFYNCFDGIKNAIEN